MQTLGVTGEGPRSVVVSVRTRPIAPADPPRCFRVTHATQSEIELSWDQPEHLFGHLAGYKWVFIPTFAHVRHEAVRPFATPADAAAKASPQRSSVQLQTTHCTASFRFAARLFIDQEEAEGYTEVHLLASQTSYTARYLYKDKVYRFQSEPCAPLNGA